MPRKLSAPVGRPRRTSRKPGASRSSAHTQTQAEATTRARGISATTGGETVVHGRDGQIRSKDTSPKGHDPNPPRDKH
ncbi:DUF2188 domain-containing protein [Amycolatopsis sp. NPDC049252]|uniref:DUF2188 domain-containing protein n=1 Tax=Amycolatopsis sp. NPDC049252 TaxID=3363933 RepID=UPI003714131F